MPKETKQTLPEKQRKRDKKGAEGVTTQITLYQSLKIEKEVDDPLKLVKNTFLIRTCSSNEKRFFWLRDQTSHLANVNLKREYEYRSGQTENES